MSAKGVLSGKVAIVTGAGRGIGKAISVGCASAAAAVCCVARTESDIARAAVEIRRDDGTASYVRRTSQTMIQSFMHSVPPLTISVESTSSSSMRGLISTTAPMWRVEVPSIG